VLVAPVGARTVSVRRIKELALRIADAVPQESVKIVSPFPKF